MLFYQILAFTIHENNIKHSYKNNKFKISAPTWDEEFELPNGSYSVLDIQDYFEYILIRYKTVTETLLIMIYVNKTKIRITFKIKIGYLNILNV